MHKWFLNTSIATRLGAGFGALVILTVIFGLFVLYQMVNLGKQVDKLYNHPFTVTRAVTAVEIETLKIHREMKDLAHAIAPDQIRIHQSRVDAYEQEALHHLETMKSRFLGDPEIVKEVFQLLVDWRPIRDEVIRFRLDADFTAADAITRGKGAQHVSLIDNELEQLKQHAARKASDSLAEAEVILSRSTYIFGLVLVAVIFLGIVIAIPIIRSIRNPLTLLDYAAARVSQGDLQQQVTVNTKDELGRLASTFNSMVVSIREQTEKIRQQNEENERLLLNILPGPIAGRLKQGEKIIADHFSEVTVLFADIVGFTKLSEKISPKNLVEVLNDLFSLFDDSSHQMGVEKIKTIGDCYMAVSGLTIEIDDPPVAMVKMAFEMQGAVEQINERHGTSFQIRIGINCGPVVAGVIGKTKFIYDLWGDTVNLASRLESHGVAGRIQVSKSVYDRVKGSFKVEARGEIDIRGKGPTPTYLIAGSV